MAKKKNLVDYIWAVTRLSLGSVFLWAFFDKLIGLGYSTCRTAEGVIETMCGKAWLSGGSPTEGFLSFATKGPFADFFQGLAGNAIVDWVFMLGLAGIGVGLILGIMVKISAYSGVLMMLLMWLAVIPPEHHPFMDDHIVYGLVLVGLTMVNDKQVLGAGAWWKKLNFVKNRPILE